MKNVMILLKDKTVITIAHRFHTIQEFKRILVFRQGNIIGDGDFNELQERNKYFKELYKAMMNA